MERKIKMGGEFERQRIEKTKINKNIQREELSYNLNKAGYTAQDAPSMRTFHLRK